MLPSLVRYYLVLNRTRAIRAYTEREQFWTGVIILSLDQMMKTRPKPASPSPNFRDTPTGGRLTLDVRLSYKVRRNRVVNMEPSSAEAEILPPDHRDPKCFSKFFARF
ncbi:hypothetical protein AVEN_242277-1 [Araneus ventricosus]|uniref:Uncharacterized protein n=1 Tax=Araneus ventricosus TaxID=182803 RepID=A0A4Y2SZ78_ARAVE|nr:hypothetical protein AVEN_242277-1 [Araneus ventricosus]